MYSIERTEYFRKLKASGTDVMNVVARFRAVTNKAEFLLLCDLFGYAQELPTDVFMLVFSYKLVDVRSTDSIDSEKSRQLGRFLDVVYDLVQETKMLDKIIVNKQFINTCGRWMAKGYVRKDKTIFLKLSKILGLAAVKMGV